MSPELPPQEPVDGVKAILQLDNNQAASAIQRQEVNRRPLFHDTRESFCTLGDLAPC